jgi:corrinoid protein of di/trimethylamine methyltransferase
VIVAILDDISAFLQRGTSKEVKELVQAALDQGIPAKSVLEDGLMAGMNIIGGKFKRNEVFVPEVLIAARAMNAGTAILKPYLASDGVKAAGKVVIGTVKGDLHDIGKNLVRMMLEGKGLEVVDLGVDVSAEKFVDALKEHKPQILALSALLTTTMNEMKTVVEAVDKAGLRGSVKIMIGGAPISSGFCTIIGADAYTPDAAAASEKAIALLQEAV